MDTMAVAPRRNAGNDLYGRSAETGVLDGVMADVRAGHGRVLVMYGEPGLGKTSLLDRTQEGASGVQVLRVDGVAGEAELSFAAVQRLCPPLREGLGHLPAPQHEALATALRLRSGLAPSAVHVGPAVHSLLAGAGGHRAVVCLLDDAHLMDPASRDVLAVAARHCTGERVAFVFTLPHTGHCPELEQFPRMTVARLADHDAHALLASRLHTPLDARIHDRMVAEAHGNPRALLDAARSIGPTEMAFCAPAEPQPPLREPWETAFRTALERLSAPAKELLVLAAAEPFGDPMTVLRAAEHQGIGRHAVEEVKGSGLVEFAPLVCFATPLLRTAAYARAPVVLRRRVHAALAHSSHLAQVPGQRAWHRGQAAVSLDDAVAAQLQDAAERTDGADSGTTTAALWELAASLTADRQTRALRLLAGARARHHTGSLRQTLHLLTEVNTAPLPDLERAQAAVLRAQTRYGMHRDAAAVRSLRQATLLAVASGHRQVHDVSVLDALTAQIFAGRLRSPDEPTDVAAAARTAPDGPSLPRARALLLQALITRTRRGYAPAVPSLRRAVDAHLAAGPEIRPLPDANGNWLMCHAAIDLWDADAWETLAERTVAAARSAGPTSALPAALVHLAFADLHRGRLDAASSRIAEADAISLAIGAVPLRHATLTLAAWRGDREGTAALAAACAREAETRGEGRLLTAVEYAQAVMHNALGAYARAFEVTTAGTALDEPASRPWLLPERLEAAARTGHLIEAEAVTDRLAHCARLTGTDWAHGIHLRARALLAEHADADAFYRRSAQRLTAAGAVLQAARTRLLWGEWLRRNGQAARARVPLGSALEAFRRAGVRGFAERAAGELAAATGRSALDASGERSVLTAQEERIARLVARGDTSKEVAAALVLSPRTVDAHLRSIFRKLGISSRRQLRHAAVLPPELRQAACSS
ncbi:LuxR C-terminal-related transcriptional regulator [Streptomyces olivaceoviridis]|uniref:LuxR C-terminal-related transcriptional regulator n=1 Tax=Streptomyces olivaceoviridis TaxID=1921 RepID=UPI0036C93DAB